MYHFFYDCSHSNSFWKDFKSYYFSLSQEQVQLSLKDISLGILTTERPLLICYLKEKYIYGGAEGMKNFQIYTVLKL